MKKLLSALGLIAILGMTSPVFAAPGHGPGGPHGGPHRGPHGGGHHISAGHHHRHHVRPHGGFTIHTGYPRHSYWGYRRGGYWGYDCFDYRLGCGGYYGPYIPAYGTSFSIRF